MNEIEQAIVALNDIYEGWASWVPQNDSLAHKNVQALGIAIDSLREKQKQEKGCEYCNNTDYIFESQQKIETPQWDEYEDGFIVIRQHINFCPMCGKKLEAKHDNT